MANRGKDFEEQIKECLSGMSKVSCDRLPDQMSGFHASSNISDFLVYKFPFQYYLECKSVKDKYFPLSNLTKKQFTGMFEKSKIPGVVAGVIIWFIDYDKTIFVDISTIVKMQMQGYKSVNVSKLDEIDHIVVPGEKKRVFFTYNGKKLMSKLEDYADEVWGDI